MRRIESVREGPDTGTQMVSIQKPAICHSVSNCLSKPSKRKTWHLGTAFNSRFPRPWLHTCDRIIMLSTRLVMDKATGQRSGQAASETAMAPA